MNIISTLFSDMTPDHWSDWMDESPCTCTKMRARVCSGIACVGSDREVIACSQGEMQESPPTTGKSKSKELTGFVAPKTGNSIFSPIVQDRY